MEEIKLMVMQAMNQKRHKRVTELHREHKFAVVDQLKEECAVANLENYEWYNVQGIDRSTSWLKNEAESLACYVRNLNGCAPTPKGKEAITKAVNAMTECLLAARLAQREYEARFPHLQAAE